MNNEGIQNATGFDVSKIEELRKTSGRDTD